jgi:phenylalanyl-tRNA synthetase beta chain
MEYSLNHLNLISNLKELTITQLINSLNLIGLEVDEFSKKTIKPKYSLENLKIFLKIPANREDLLIEDFFLQEISLVFFFEIFYLWKKISKNYNFLLKQKYLEYSDYSTVFIDEKFDSLITYAFEIENFENHSSPLWIRTKLQNQGIEIFNNFNDIVNLVILEWGQPINRSLLSTSSSFSKYRLERINSVDSGLPNGTIVMKNEKEETLMILGVLNIDLETNSSKKLLVEISFYDIEKNQLEITLLNPKISLKYFRKMFLEKIKYSFQRLFTLIEILQYGSLLPVKYFTPKQKISLTTEKLLILKKKSLENILKIQKIEDTIFQQAGLNIICKTPKEFYFKIPNSRKDLAREIDVIEEYSRFFGYKNFQEIIPEKKIRKEKPFQKSISFLKEYFLNFGFNEIVTTSIQEQFEKTSIQITNPLTKESSYLRTSLLPKLVDIYVQNLRSSSVSNNFFEVGRIFKKYQSRILEENKIAAIFQFPQNISFSQNSTEWFSAIGFVENILLHYGYSKIEKQSVFTSFVFVHPNRSVLLKSGKKILGIFGEISPNYEKFTSLKKPTYFLELNLIYLSNYQQSTTPTVYKEYSKYPKITKDLSCLLPKNTNFYNLKHFLEKNCNYLKNILFFDIYFDKNNPDFVNIGLRFEFQSDTTTLTNEIIELEIEKSKKFLVSHFNSKIR